MLRDALVVGINSYEHLPGLQAPAHDAEAIAQILHSHGEFRVHRMPEVLQNGVPQIGKKTPVRIQDLEAALVNLFKPKGSNIPHTALFYFSGHGIQREAGICDGYLALADSNPATGFYGLSLFWLRRLLQESPVRQRIILLDCCHSGELLNFLDADPGARMGTDRLFMAASREYESAYESIDGPYSVFTAALQTALNPQHSSTGVVTSHSLTHAVSQALKGEIQQPLFESSGSEIILTRSTSEVVQSQLPSDEMCPYRGLESFEEAHADWFYGRETLVKQLANALKGKNFLAVVGASGVGKSSVVKAGLMPALRRGGHCPGSDRWPIKFMTPTGHPLKSLAGVFLDPQLSDLERAEQLCRVETFLHNGGTGLAQLVRASLPVDTETTTRSNGKPRMVLIIDQFEELFTLCRGAEAEHEQRQFLNCLVRSLQLVPDLLSIVIVLRSDVQNLCSAYDDLNQLIESNQVLVPGLTYEQLKSVITQPAKKAGLICDPNLVYTLLLDVIGAPGELPLLQYTLAILWEQRQIDPTTQTARLTLDAYTHLGGIRGALQTQASNLFYRLSSEEQSIAKRIFLALTQLGEGTEDTRRRVLKTELVTPRCPLHQVERVLEKLVQAKLVVLDQRHQSKRNQSGIDPKSHHASATHAPVVLDQSLWAFGASPVLVSTAETATTVDIAHEALIRGWPLLRTWLDDNREKLRQQRRIEQVAQDWYDSGEPTNSEYLLTGGLLQNAELYWSDYVNDLSELARRYVDISLKEKVRARRESRLLQVSIPSVLLVALAVTVTQYRSAIATKIEQSQQLNLVLAREKTAIAQTVLQEPASDPTTTLLLSRLAVEGAPTQEAQRMLRSALQTLRLQHTLSGQTGKISSIAFSANAAYMAIGSDDGNIQIWRATPNTVAVEPPTLINTFSWATVSLPSSSDPAQLETLALSHQGDKLAAVVRGSNQLKVWDVNRGSQAFLITTAQPIEQAVFSPDGRWVVTATDRSLSLWGAETGQLLTRIAVGHSLKTVQFSPDGQRLMTAEQNGTVSLWTINADSALKPQLQLIHAIQHSVSLQTALFSPKGRWILTLGSDHQSRLWNAATGELQKTYTPNAQPRLARLKQTAKLASQGRVVSPAPAQAPAVVQVVFSPDEERVALLDSAAQLWMWNVKTDQVWVRSLAGSSNNLKPVLQMAFSPNGDWLAISNQQPDDHQLWPVFLLESKTGREEAVLRGHQQAITAIQFSADGTYVATGDQTGKVHLWATQTQGELPTLTASRSALRWMRFRQPAERMPASEIAQAELTTDQSIAAPTGHLTQPLFAMAHFNQMSRWRKLLSWERTTEPLPNHSSTIDSAIADQSMLPLDLLAVNTTGQINQWKIENGSVVPSAPAGVVPSGVLSSVARESTSLAGGTIAALDISLDGRSMAIARSTGGLEIQRQQADGSFSQPEQLVAPSNETSGVRQLVFSPNGTQLISLGEDFQVRVWSLAGKRIQHVLHGHEASVQTAQFSPDGRQIVTASSDGTVRLWDAATGKELHTIQVRGQVNMASFSPDNQHIVTATANGVAEVFEAKTGQTLYTLENHQASILEAHFSPNGQQIATASADGSVRLWDVASRQEQSQLNPTQGQTGRSIQQIFFSPDSQYLATLTDDGNLQIWAATWESLLKLARDRTLRQLTAEECELYLQLPLETCPKLDTATQYSLQR